ncbi:PHD finger protein 24-like [Haliotis asinina]|uniref:PHD finger protein 24-like n=1 Tax=Haliotis asinina TaxID=109174 RepID=UPI003531FEBA
MGSGASTEGKGPEARKRRYKNAVLVIGSFSKHTNQARKQQKRLELIMHIERIKMENNADYEEAVRGNADPHRFRQRSATSRKDTDIPDSFVPDTDKPTWEAYYSDPKCWLCRKVADDDAHPCRVCTRIFHQECLEQCGECRKVDALLTKKSRTNIGWSCYICSNLSVLLNDAELEELIESFENYDKDKDGYVSWDEFSEAKGHLLERREERQVTEFDTRLMKVDFQVADVDSDGRLDWWEFVNHEAKKLLAKRDRRELVDLLTEKELLVAKALFRTLDKNGDGTVTELEAREAFRHWYRHFEDEEMERRLGRESSNLELHVNLNTKMIMHADSCDREVLTWASFLMEQGLYLLCNRPNITFSK